MNRLGNDQNTCFCLDNWFGNKPLSIQYPTLFSHVQNSNINVADAYSEIGWQLRFRHITTHRAEKELISLLHELENVTLTEVPDECFMRFGRVLHSRLSAGERLVNRGVIDEANCPFGCQTEESLAHLLFHCPHTSYVWNRLQILNRLALHSMQGVITNNTNMPTVQRKEWATILIANAWNIWLARNQKVFDGITLRGWRKTVRKQSCFGPTDATKYHDAKLLKTGQRVRLVNLFWNSCIIIQG
jgi:hypothetical protein